MVSVFSAVGTGSETDVLIKIRSYIVAVVLVYAMVHRVLVSWMPCLVSHDQSAYKVD